MKQLYGWTIIVVWFLLANLAMDVAKWFGGTVEFVIGMFTVASFAVATYWADLYLGEGG